MHLLTNGPSADKVVADVSSYLGISYAKKWSDSSISLFLSASQLLSQSSLIFASECFLILDKEYELCCCSVHHLLSYLLISYRIKTQMRLTAAIRKQPFKTVAIVQAVPAALEGTLKGVTNVAWIQHQVFGQLCSFAARPAGVAFWGIYDNSNQAIYAARFGRFYFHVGVVVLCSSFCFYVVNKLL